LTALSLASREPESALYNINLLPTDPKAKSKRSRKSTTLYLAAITCCLLIAFFASHFFQNKMALEALDIQLKEIKSQAGSLQLIDLEYDSTHSIANKIISAQKKNPLRLPALQELSNVLPKDTWLISISIYQDQMEITGFSSSASSLVPLIENSPWFQNSRFMGSIVNGKKGEKFTIHTELAES
jgi:general secretion pathway protein L